MIRHVIRASLAVSLFAASVTPLAAQGNLSTQGFGYPTGQFSSRVLGTGGALSELDPLTPINPAALSAWGAPAIFLQYDPEFRRVNAAGGEDRTTTARAPLVAVGMPLGSRVQIGISTSTFLDRSWSTSFQTTQTIADEAAVVTNVFRSVGAINDVRLGVAYGLGNLLKVGVGAHVLTGRNTVTERQLFEDTLRYQNVTLTSEVSYTGTAASIGGVMRPSSTFNVAASARFGGTMRSRNGDTLLTTAKVPNRYSASLAYTGINGATIGARVARESWSAMDGLGSTNVTTFDATDIGAGVEATGPRIENSTMLLRLGVRHRTLPFGADGNRVKELAFSGGIGASLARDRASFDFTAQRASRSAEGSASGIKEKAWTLSMGIRVRP